MKKLLQDFRDFITRGNVIDLAIGIIIGSAFSTVVNSIVNNLIMPPLGLLIGNVNFKDRFILLKQGDVSLPPGATLELAKELGAVTFNYGQFITDLVSFLILGLGVFLIVKAIQSFEKKVIKANEEEKPVPTEKKCPYCQMEISIKATRCPFCTSTIEIKEEIEHA